MNNTEKIKTCLSFCGKGGKPLADLLPTLTIKAKDFATELTSHNVTEKNLRGENTVSKGRIDNNLAVRKNAY